MQVCCITTPMFVTRTERVARRVLDCHSKLFTGGTSTVWGKAPEVQCWNLFVSQRPRLGNSLSTFRFHVPLACKVLGLLVGANAMTVVRSVVGIRDITFPDHCFPVMVDSNARRRLVLGTVVLVPFSHSHRTERLLLFNHDFDSVRSS